MTTITVSDINICTRCTNRCSKSEAIYKNPPKIENINIHLKEIQKIDAILELRVCSMFNPRAQFTVMEHSHNCNMFKTSRTSSKILHINWPKEWKQKRCRRTLKKSLSTRSVMSIDQRKYIHLLWKHAFTP